MLFIKLDVLILSDMGMSCLLELCESTFRIVPPWYMARNSWSSRAGWKQCNPGGRYSTSRTWCMEWTKCRCSSSWSRRYRNSEFECFERRKKYGSVQFYLHKHIWSQEYDQKGFQRLGDTSLQFLSCEMFSFMRFQVRRYFKALLHIKVSFVHVETKTGIKWLFVGDCWTLLIIFS